jgi:peroxiredoxin
MFVRRADILDYVTYNEQREQIRAAALVEKARRRITIAGVLTFLFENRATIRYQVLEMVRAEKIIREADIQHEIATYNELLGGPGELGCTLLIGIDDPRERQEKLARWLALPHHIYIEAEDGRRIRGTWDPRQVGDMRLSSVQYIRFPVGEARPVALGVDHPELDDRVALSEEQRAALAADLRESYGRAQRPAPHEEETIGATTTMSSNNTPAPDFTLLNTKREAVSLASLRGQTAVLAFIPAAFTGVCEKELCTFRDSLASFNDVGAKVFGVSVDAPFSNAAFAAKMGLNFEILSDYDRAATRAFDVAHDDFAGMAGYTASKRSVFVIDGEGVIRYRWVAPNPGVEPDYAEVKAAVAALGASASA